MVEAGDDLQLLVVAEVFPDNRAQAFPGSDNMDVFDPRLMSVSDRGASAVLIPPAARRLPAIRSNKAPKKTACVLKKMVLALFPGPESALLIIGFRVRVMSSPLQRI